MLDVYLNYIDRVSQNIGIWASHHLLNVIVILIGTYILRVLGIKAISKAASHTIRQDLFPTAAERRKRVETLQSLINAGVKLGTWLLAIVMIVSELGINTAPLLASAGLLGVAFGFGAQSLIKDFVNGIFIITENQYRVGDVVEIGKISGTVEAITIRVTIIRDLAGNLHYVPNGTISVTTNMTSHFSRLSEEIVVSPDTNLDQLEHLIKHIGEMIAAMPEFKNKILDPPKFFQVSGIRDGGVGVKILATVTEGEQWGVKSAFYKILVKEAPKKGIVLITSKQVTLLKPKG